MCGVSESFSVAARVRRIAVGSVSVVPVVFVSIDAAFGACGVYPKCVCLAHGLAPFLTMCPSARGCENYDCPASWP